MLSGKKQTLLKKPGGCSGHVLTSLFGQVMLLKLHYLSNGRMLTICFIPGGDFFFFWAVIVSYTNFWMIVGNQFVQFPASFCFSAMFHSKLNSMCLLRVCLLAKTS